jgi:hypothetical protein
MNAVKLLRAVAKETKLASQQVLEVLFPGPLRVSVLKLQLRLCTVPIDTFPPQREHSTARFCRSLLIYSTGLVHSRQVATPPGVACGQLHSNSAPPRSTKIVVPLRSKNKACNDQVLLM